MRPLGGSGLEALTCRTLVALECDKRARAQVPVARCLIGRLNTHSSSRPSVVITNFLASLDRFPYSRPHLVGDFADLERMLAVRPLAGYRSLDAQADAFASAANIRSSESSASERFMPSV